MVNNAVNIIHKRVWHKADKYSCYRLQWSWGKVMFLQVCGILFTGVGSTWPGTPPGTRYTPQTRYTPPDQVHLLDQVKPPWDQVHPPGTTPLDQVHPAGPGTPPRTRYTPLDQVHPPTRYTPGTRYNPRDQVHPPGTRYTPWTKYPPGPGTPPPRTREIRSTRGRYASCWNRSSLWYYFYYAIL